MVTTPPSRSQHKVLQIHQLHEFAETHGYDGMTQNGSPPKQTVPVVQDSNIQKHTSHVLLGPGFPRHSFDPHAIWMAQNSVLVGRITIFEGSNTSLDP